MKTKTYNVYEFKELSKEAKAWAIEKYYQEEDFPFLSEDLREELAELDTLKLFKEVKLQYSLGSCQGDGLSFEAQIDLNAFLQSKGYAPATIERLGAACYKIHSKGNGGRYCYASESDIEIEDNGDATKAVEKWLERLRVEIAAYYMDICKKLEKAGYAILEHRMDEEEFSEHCEANGYEFKEDGSRD